MSIQDSRQVSNVKVMLNKGASGGTIVSVEKTSTSGLVDTYTATMSNGDRFTFEVTNGSSIADIQKTSTSGAVDTYTVYLTNGDTSTFTVTNGVGTIASDIGYDNTSSGLSATKVQGAIDEVEAQITALNKGSVSVTANGSETFRELLHRLYVLLDLSKVNSNTIIDYRVPFISPKFNGYIFHFSSYGGNNNDGIDKLTFSQIDIMLGNRTASGLYLASSTGVGGCEYRTYDINTSTETDKTLETAEGTFTLYY